MKCNVKRKAFNGLWIFLLPILTAKGVCQPQPSVHYSLAQFYDDSTHTIVELYFGVWSDQLTYAAAQGGSGKNCAALEFTMAAEGATGASFNEQWRFGDCRSMHDSSDNFLVGKHSFILPPGAYSLRITVIDTNAREHSGTTEIPSFAITDEFTKPGLHISGIELGNSLRRAGGEISSFIKNGYEIIPNVLNRYDDRNLRLSYYAELYNTGLAVSGDSFHIQTVIYDAEGNIYYAKTVYYPKSASPIILANSLSIKPLATGKYYLRIIAYPSTDKLDTTGYVMRIKEFSVENSNILPLADRYNIPQVNDDEFENSSGRGRTSDRSESEGNHPAFTVPSWLQPSSHIYLMPTAIPIGKDHGYVADYELLFPYAGIGVYNIFSVTGGMTFIPGAPIGSQVYTAMLKATIADTDGFAFALAANVLDVSTTNTYIHLYAVATDLWKNTWFSGALFYKTAGPDIAVENAGVIGSTAFMYTGNLGVAFGFESPISRRSDMRIIGEIWNNDVSNYANTIFMFGVRVRNEHLSSDFGFAFLHLPFFPVPMTNFAFSW